MIIENLIIKTSPNTFKHKSDYIKNLFHEFEGTDNQFYLITKKLDQDIKSEHLKELLDLKTKTFKKYSITQSTKCLLLYYGIRNIGAHEMESIDGIGKNFFEIARYFLFLFFILLIRADKIGTIPNK